jgi:hypothetical protein
MSKDQDALKQMRVLHDAMSYKRVTWCVCLTDMHDKNHVYCWYTE